MAYKVKAAAAAVRWACAWGGSRQPLPYMPLLFFGMAKTFFCDGAGKPTAQKMRFVSLD